MKRPFEQLVADHGAAVLRVCRSMVGMHDADDAWSDTFLAALRAYPELPETANTEAWLVTIAHRKCIDILRAGARHAIPMADPPERASTLGVPDDGDELWDAVARLPDKQRETIAYHYGAGLPYAEIADLIGGTAAAARRAASDGIAALRTQFETQREDIRS
ncbi:RNA polymerase sigma factor [Leifsonia poae]|uniref:RNA polymerase sigma24 factor n=1 Tax=Leifsonia poae TaxID=110933 RepID=A0A9W6HC77_9MICO|nr:RNA polymerase sigma factor [Leifsonia poae]GLJ77108.1 RNA polymerase sigma24 factor [Leifsonia poae]